MQALPVAPQGIAGGFVLVPVQQLLTAWRACQRNPLGVGDFRTWLSCREMLARRCTIDDGRSPTYGFAELARLTGVSGKRARASVNKLVGAGLLTWTDRAIQFPDTEPGPGTGPDHGTLVDSIGGGKGSLAIPRRILRLMVGGARPALIATVLAILLRCLSRGRGGFNSRGRLKASWIARVFDVDLRRVKQARKELIDLGWIVPEHSDQWAENSWGRVYHIDLAWGRTAVEEGPRLPPPPAAGGRRLPPPDLHPEPLREDKNQDLASGGPTGVEIQETEEKSISSSTSPADLAKAPPQPRLERGQESAPGRSAGGEDGSGTSPAVVEPERSVPSRPAVVANGAGGGDLPAPTLKDIRVVDLKDTGRLLELHGQAVGRELITASEADRLRFLGAAEHAVAVGKENPCGLFIHLVRGRLWRYLTQEDEDAAVARLKRHLFGAPRGCGPGSSRSPVAARRELSRDAMLVREVRASLARAGYRGDPFPMVMARDASWTRVRWDAACAELGVVHGRL